MPLKRPAIFASLLAPTVTAFASLLVPLVLLGPGLLAGCSSSQGGEDMAGSSDLGTADADLRTEPADLMLLPDACRGKALPADGHYVPKGLCARVVVDTPQGKVRQITFAPNGDLFAVTGGGAILRLRDENGDGVYQDSEITPYASTGGNGNNCHIDVAGGYLYAGSPAGVMRWPWSPSMTSGGTGQAVVINQPSNGSHTLHTVHVYDHFLYVLSGSVDNMPPKGLTDYDQNRALVRRFDLSQFNPAKPFDWGDSGQGQVVADGLRNTVGFTKNAAGRIYGVVNGMDDMQYTYTTPMMRISTRFDNPGEEVVLLDPARKLHYGYPFCYTVQGMLRNPQDASKGVFAPGSPVRNDQYLTGTGLTVTDAWCASHVTPPVTFIQAHTAPLDIAFYDGPFSGLPDRWRGGAFVSLHGSWDRKDESGNNISTGHQVVWLPFSADGSSPMPQTTARAQGAFPPTATTFPYEVVFGGGSLSGGPKDGAWSYLKDNPVRPVGVAVSPVDGALYISSDIAGYIYRIGLAR